MPPGDIVLPQKHCHQEPPQEPTAGPSLVPPPLSSLSRLGLLPTPPGSPNLAEESFLPQGMFASPTRLNDTL